MLPMKSFYLLFFLLTLTLITFSTGCVSNRANIGAWRDSDFSPMRTNKIALTLMSNPSDEDAELGRAMTAELKRENFNLVPFEEADYTLACVVEDDSEEIYTPSQQPFLSTPPQIILQTYDPSTFQTRQTWFPPTLVVLHKKDIRLYLFTNPKTHPGRLQIVWTGSIDIGGTVSAKREPELLEMLLGHFGQAYAGSVNLAK
jgi:hypothetical protein